MNTLYGGIEFGGTKTICAVGYADGQLIAHKDIPTTSVEETLQAIYDFFDSQSEIAALGVGSFGPLNINEQSQDYGSIYNAPKAGWVNVTLKTLLDNHFRVPIKFDLDVNCAALGELHYGVASDVTNFVYLTLGTGIGGSLIINKQTVHGILNLEMGHMRVPYALLDEFNGSCEFHGDCLEGIASGYAMLQHYGIRAEEIDSVRIWDQEAGYIASALHNIVMTMGPERIVLGGGLLQHDGFIEHIRSKLSVIINDYLQTPNLDDYIVKSSGQTNGVRGAIKLVTRA